MAIAATAPRSVPLTLVGTTSPAPASPAPASPAPASPAPASTVAEPDFAVRVVADDPVSLLGLRAQFDQAGVPVCDAIPAAVTVMIFDRLGPDAQQQLRDVAADSAAVLVILTDLDADVTLAAMALGASGVLRRRDLSAERLKAAVRSARAAEVTFPIDLFARMTGQAGRSALGAARAEGAGSESACSDRGRRADISDRERDVLRLIADGNSTREVAVQLCYSERTIKNVLQDLSVRLDLRNRTHVVSHAIRHGWI